MKTNRFFVVRGFARIAPLFIAAGLSAAPLTWFPGPSLDAPISGAATTVISGGNNLLIGGDSYGSPEYLAATNAYWTYLPGFYGGATISAGVSGSGDPLTFYGGTDGTNSTSDVFSYSPSGDGTYALGSLSVPRSYLGYATDGSGTAYAIGGLDGNGLPLASAESYNQDLNTWAGIASMPTTVYNFPAVFDKTNGIYIFGGSTNTAPRSETTAVFRYSTKNKNWTAVAPLPVAVAGSAAALAAGGKIYVVGGVSGGVTTDVVQVYNLASNSWTISTPLPEGLSAAAMGVDSLGRLVVMGGMDANGFDVSDVWRSQELAIPDIAPTLTEYPATNGSYLAPYASTISATGNPQPTYLMVSGPSTMQVDPYSGAISWTPGAGDIGTNLVTVRATNYAGYSDWTFDIVVPHPPPTDPANLRVVSVTDNSVTLAWDPESPVVGAVTYGVYLRHSVHDPKGSGGSVWFTQIGANTTVPMITITGLAPGTAQTYYVAARGPGGSSGTNSSIGATTTAPQGPPDLFVTGLTSTSVSLAWDPAPGPAQNPNYSPVTSYTITERIASPAQNIPTVANITGTNGTVTGLKPGSSHIWYVAGVDAAGNSSSLTYVYVTVNNPVPASPTLSGVASSTSGGFQFTASEGGSILQTVLIQATTNPADPNSWTQIGSLLPTSNPFTFTDTNSAQYPSRFYRLVAP